MASHSASKDAESYPYVLIWLDVGRLLTAHVWVGGELLPPLVGHSDDSILPS